LNVIDEYTFIKPGSPWENGYIESFNSKMRDELLTGEDVGLFSLYPELSGLLFFEEPAGSYLFRFWSNPFATLSSSVADGWISRAGS
jgi:transposase InsO family protein